MGCGPIGVTTQPKEIQMPWTKITRPQYRRDGLRYASDMTDEEWALIEPYVPSPRIVSLGVV